MSLRKHVSLPMACMLALVSFGFQAEKADAANVASNGKYVYADPNISGALYANSDNIGTWERFELQ
ncbi:fascin domain-containing protein [Paenibacillus gansuensis]|uniref:Uncharacterized protein n=1 Tax=Paenibacillus gansuensis TaxID=306542 RepID=A0ABW5PG86_9BACL